MLSGFDTKQKEDLVKFIGPSRYHNMIINPGATGYDGGNPGFTLLKINTTS
jgi:hypothetical protein